MRSNLKSKQKENPKVSHFRARLTAKLVVIFICVTMLGQRLSFALVTHDVSQTAALSFRLSMPFLLALSLIVLVEYYLYRKLGNRMLKYSKFIDIAFSLVFTAEWMATLNAQLSVSPVNGTLNFTMSAVISFTSFSWRALLPILITQQWQLKIIPPTAAYIYLLTFATTNQPNQTFQILMKGIFQALYVILIYYFEHRINFKLLIGNVQQEQWLQLNDFILNNIPENIAIMDTNGNCNFLSENFEKLLRLRSQSQNTKQFFKNIHQIQRLQQEETDSGDLESLPEVHADGRVASSESRNEVHLDTNYDSQSIFSLNDLIVIFGNLIVAGSIKERFFQMFTGKFKQEDSDEERSFEIKISYINHQPNKYILLILRDITQRDLVSTLEDNIRYKDHLLASVSHELRTPLNGNINLLEAAIKSKDISDKIKEALLIPAVRSSQFLLHLINDILDMSQIKAQKLRLVFQQKSLKETLNNTIQLMELHAKKKGLSLKTDISPDLPDIFCTDHVRLTQIILNLINNSIKFTQKGSVRLSAWCLADSNCVKVSVEDTGIGMTQDDINRLFQDFTHIEFKNREKLNPSGVGLGLKIGNDLAKLLGPENNTGIMVTSQLGKGSTFSFLIENKETGLGSQDIKLDCKEEFSPLVPNELHSAIEPDLGTKVIRNIPAKSLLSLARIDIPSISSIPSCLCPTVLVVDDDPFNIMAYEAILDSLGVKYDCVYSGRSAIDKMLNKVRYPCSAVCSPYKVVFMDEEMPEMTGREAVAEIDSLQKQNLLPPTHIVGCTAHRDGEAIEGFLKCGITEYIPKPVSAGIIQRILKKYRV